MSPVTYRERPAFGTRRWPRRGPEWAHSLREVRVAILITGGTGFIGAEIVRQLLDVNAHRIR